MLVHFSWESVTYTPYPPENKPPPLFDLQLAQVLLSHLQAPAPMLQKLHCQQK